jgi:hypothetical protein
MATMDSPETVNEIQKTYDALGLGTSAARSQFANWFAPERPKLHFDVVISTTSNPLHG